jgi:hypothetical protein
MPIGFIAGSTLNKNFFFLFLTIFVDTLSCAESHFFEETSSQVTKKLSHDFDFFGNLKTCWDPF